ncbi:cell wall-associated NlpC family hydrolase [Clostridium punense]|uniref:Cell wall-associated NlpC family hydrolase n=1 Tax=Clostridium punense TaxID=1054297 RepID=A0ABS4K8D6_9CLOT|nr:C40 family peptidase [Clostridium punense]MBP2024023.1 cell wall-associated NlpC family hydrolase [Clostridium punense]
MKSKHIKCLVSIAFAVGISLKLNNGIAVADPNIGNESTSLKSVSGVVIADALNVRSSGNTSSSVLGKLYSGDNITIIESVNGWHKINFQNKVGWVYGEFVETKKTIKNTSNKTGTITADSLNIRSGAGTSFSILGSLKSGAKIDIIDSANGWFQISYNGATGYVSGEYVTLNTGNSDNSRPSRGDSESNFSVNKLGTVKVSALNFRTGPGTNYDVIQSLKEGTKLEVIEETKGWYKCVYNNNTGYVSKEFVNLSDSSATAPTPAPETPTTVPTINGKVALISVDALNVRSGAGTNYDKIEVARYGDKFPITAHSNGWYKISIGGKEGWIYGEYIKIINSTDAVPPVVRETSTIESQYSGEDIVAMAEKYLGTPYLWGGFTPLGFDCSGLVQYVYRQLGIELERTSYYQVHQGVTVSRDDLKPGDLLFFTTDDSRPDAVSHVGIYKGNDLFVQAPKPGDVVRVSNLNSAYYSARYYIAKRIIK